MHIKLTLNYVCKYTDVHRCMHGNIYRCMYACVNGYGLYKWIIDIYICANMNSMQYIRILY